MEISANLASMLLDEKLKGKSYTDMELKHGIPAIECYQIVRDALAAIPVHSQVEQRQLASLRLEKIIQGIWDEMASGSFKHAEAMTKVVHEMSELNDLIQKTVTHEIVFIQDQQAALVLNMLELVAEGLLNRVNDLPLNQKAKKALEEWPEWAAEITTDAVSAVVYAEEVK